MYQKPSKRASGAVWLQHEIDVLQKCSDECFAIEEQLPLRGVGTIMDLHEIREQLFTARQVIGWKLHRARETLRDISKKK